MKQTTQISSTSLESQLAEGRPLGCVQVEWGGWRRCGKWNGEGLKASNGQERKSLTGMLH